MRTAVKSLARLFNFRPSSANTNTNAYIYANNASSSTNPNNDEPDYRKRYINSKRGLVLGVWSDQDVPNGLKMTDSGREINRQTKGLLLNILKSPYIWKRGNIKVLRQLRPEFNYITVVKLDGQCTRDNVEEVIDNRAEAVRIASAIGCRKLKDLGMEKIEVDDFDGLASSAAEGSILGTYDYDPLALPGQRLIVPGLQPYDIRSNWEKWNIGLVKASSQNYARQLMAIPGHLLTPKKLAQNIKEVLSRSGVSVELKGEDWIKKNGMSGTLAMAEGSCEPPHFLELSYHGGENKGENPVILVGSAIILSLYTANANRRLKPNEEMILMPGDIGGAACVAAVTRAVAELKLPINLRALIPLVENIPGVNFMQPGFRIILMDGSIVQIYGSEVAGQIVLAEALHYSNNFKPRVVLSVSSSCPWLVEPISTPAAPAFTPLDSLSTRIRLAVYHTGDRVVRLPLRNIPKERMFNDEGQHVLGRDDTLGSKPLFLKKFIHSRNWIHFETDSVMFSRKQTPYLWDGCSGRPTRTLIELIAQLTCIDCK